tara:strand:+ start:911 stop:2224 length:1314 start_codon:yes stop_codon:yes gene_type:complete
MNLIPEFIPSGKTQSALTNWPGAKPFTSGSGADRGMHVFAGTLYKVSGTTLEGIASNGTRTTIGTVDGFKPCIFADDGNTMRIATGSKDYQLISGVLSEITDPDLKSGNSVAYINQQMINDSDGGQFQVSDVGVPGSIAANNFATAESSPDDTVRVYTFNERLYLFGNRNSVETWWNSGTGNPPFDRVQGGAMNVGISSPYSVASTTAFTYFMGFDKAVYRFSATQPESITPPAIAAEFQEFSTTEDARSYVVNIEGMSFYVINFPTVGQTYAYNEDGNTWFQLSSGANKANYLGTSYAKVYGKQYIASGGDVLELDCDTFTDNGLTTIRERVTAPIFAPEGGRIEMSSFTLLMETGVGLISGQGVNPKVMFEASYDGGKSWSDEDWVEIGRMGQGRVKVVWDNMASAYDIMIRVRVSDPVFISFHGASIMLRQAGW